jgi:cytochrome P450
MFVRQVYKGDFISFLPYLMGRSEALWGEDAAVFRPERHLTTVEGEGGVKKRVFKPPNPFVFTAFQAGPRVCMGQQLAYMEMKVTHHKGPCGACLVKNEKAVACMALEKAVGVMSRLGVSR